MTELPATHVEDLGEFPASGSRPAQPGNCEHLRREPENGSCVCVGVHVCVKERERVGLSCML